LDLKKLFEGSSVIEKVDKGEVVAEGDGSSSSLIPSTQRDDKSKKCSVPLTNAVDTLQINAPIFQQSKEKSSPNFKDEGKGNEREEISMFPMNPASLYTSTPESSSRNDRYQNHPHQRKVEKEDARSLSAVGIAIRPNNPLRLLAESTELENEEQEEEERVEDLTMGTESGSRANTNLRKRSRDDREELGNVGLEDGTSPSTSASISDLINSKNQERSSRNDSSRRSGASSSSSSVELNSNNPNSDDRASLEHSWSTYFAHGVFHPSYDSAVCLDPIRANLITLSRGHRLFEAFFNVAGNKKQEKKEKYSRSKSSSSGGNGLSTFIHIFDPNLSSFSYVRNHSGFLLSVIFLVSSEFELEKDLPKESENEQDEDEEFAKDSLSAVYGIGYFERKLEREKEKKALMEHVEKLLPTVFDGRFKSVELAQACFLLSQFQPLSQSAMNDKTWTLLGNASEYHLKARIIFHHKAASLKSKDSNK